LRKIARTIFAALDLTDADLSIVLTDDETIRALNRDWRGKDRATDVLSFSQLEGEGPTAGPRMLGDVVISMETAARQAQKTGRTLDAEVCHLLVHGVLHLFGHDHVRGGAQARRMKAEERRVLARIAEVDRAAAKRGAR
jgi:probable rRNA maturation factor